jgi:hypothetical protein
MSAMLKSQSMESRKDQASQEAKSFIQSTTRASPSLSNLVETKLNMFSVWSKRGLPEQHTVVNVFKFRSIRQPPR